MTYLSRAIRYVLEIELSEARYQRLRLELTNLSAVGMLVFVLTYGVVAPTHVLLL